MNKYPQVIFDVHEQDWDIIKLIENKTIRQDKGEVLMFPNFKVEELKQYDENAEEWVQTCDVTNEFNSMAIEHKVIHKINKHSGQTTWGDFHASITSKRLQDQCAKMHVFYEKNKHVIAQGYLVNYST